MKSERINNGPAGFPVNDGTDIKVTTVRLDSHGKPYVDIFLVANALIGTDYFAEEQLKRALYAVQQTVGAYLIILGNMIGSDYLRGKWARMSLVPRAALNQYGTLMKPVIDKVVAVLWGRNEIEFWEAIHSVEKVLNTLFERLSKLALREGKQTLPPLVGMPGEVMAVNIEVGPTETYRVLLAPSQGKVHDESIIKMDGRMRGLDVIVGGQFDGERRPTHYDYVPGNGEGLQKKFGVLIVPPGSFSVQAVDKSNAKPVEALGPVILRLCSDKHFATCLLPEAEDGYQKYFTGDLPRGFATESFDISQALDMDLMLTRSQESKPAKLKRTNGKRKNGKMLKR